MGSPSCERIGLAHFLAPIAALRAIGNPRLATDLEAQARQFCEALAEHRRSADYKVRLRPPVDFGLDALTASLLTAADDLRQDDDDAAALGAWCCALAARLTAVLTEPDPAVSRILVFVERDAAGLGELRLLPYDPDDAATVPGLDEEPAQ